VTAYVALLRAVNVGGTGKLPMADLRAMCTGVGFTNVRTYIASGNVVFHSDLTASKAQSTLTAALAEYAGRPVGVLIRTAAEIATTLAQNPFTDAPGNRVTAIFLDAAPTEADLTAARQLKDEHLACGPRAIYVHYPSGMGASKLTLPAAQKGTARNMNTVAKLVKMVQD